MSRLSREKTLLIVQDLARGHRSVLGIADRHSVTVQTVELLRDTYGPALGDLMAAAAELRRSPASVEAPDPTPWTVFAPEPAPALTREERAACRRWADSHLPPGSPAPSAFGRVPRGVIDAWIAAGRPDPNPPTPPPTPPPVPTPIPASAPTTPDAADAPVTMDEWLTLARAHPALGTWIDAVDQAWADLTTAWQDMAADAHTRVRELARELADAEAAAALIAPPQLRAVS